MFDSAEAADFNDTFEAEAAFEAAAEYGWNWEDDEGFCAYALGATTPEIAREGKRRFLVSVSRYSPKENGIRIGADFFPCASVKEAVDAWFGAVQTYGWGASDAPRASLVWDGETYRVSFNGRFWTKDGEEFLFTE